MWTLIDTERRTKEQPHPFVEERRKPINVATVNNHDAECLRRIAAAGGCTCEQQEVEGTP